MSRCCVITGRLDFLAAVILAWTRCKFAGVGLRSQISYIEPPVVMPASLSPSSWLCGLSYGVVCCNGGVAQRVRYNGFDTPYTIGGGTCCRGNCERYMQCKKG